MKIFKDRLSGWRIAGLFLLLGLGAGSLGKKRTLLILNRSLHREILFVGSVIIAMVGALLVDAKSYFLKILGWICLVISAFLLWQWGMMRYALN